jgi:ferric-dicitrate binding protein FerR (iron transport regulator)
MTPRVPDDLDYERLARYFAGECSAPEAAAIRAWIAADETRRRRVEQLHRGWEAAGETVLRGDLERGWAAIAAKLDDAADGPAPAPHTSRASRASHVFRLQPATAQSSPWLVGSRVAAIVVAVALGAVTARQLGWRKPDASPAAQSAVMREVTTRRGQQANVYLSDGTRVVLGVASTLRFPTAFVASRDVELDGEAYFEVAEDTTRSFAVHMRYGTARDLGTRFAVRAYGDVARATVTVTEGSVVLTPIARRENRLNGAAASRIAERNADRANDIAAAANVDSLILRAMDVASVSADGQLSVTRGVKTDPNIAWVSGRVVFDQMPVPEAIAQINRWYDADVRLGDSTLARFTLTASLTNEPFPRAIEVIASALDARVVRRDSTFTLYRARARR